MSPLLRLIIVSGATSLLAIHFLAPLFKTFIPIWRAEGQISWEIAGRLLARFSLFVLALLWILLTLEELRPGTFFVGVLNWGAAVAWIGVALGAITSWVCHPLGIRGL